ncbi:hypothetical protein P378_20620 [Desulforamulus profundi]|uniref:Uncharacterized protein n=1 Tax=Desulforamulus profundi TaxID=1383067 RepID=A0A2C6MB44_9FIRM|nr:hypothetical protein [Desulforamulus profundi]PHJ36715.1 hypothetical protein P378_20620 [Desulforamulus profundi]
MLTHIALLGFSFIFIVFLEAPRLVKQGLWRELAVFSVILSTGYILAFLQVFGVLSR